jgi:hypothetical protein
MQHLEHKKHERLFLMRESLWEHKIHWLTEGVPHTINNGDRLPFLDGSQVKMKEYGEVFVQHSDTCTKHYFQL